MEKVNIFKLLFISSLIESVNSAHIIGVPSIGKSHGLVLMKIGRELVARGHKYSLVVPSAFADDLKPRVSLKGLQVVSFKSDFTKEDLEKLMIKQSRGELDMYENMALWIGVCNGTLKSDIYSQNLQDINFMLCDIGSLCCPILADKLGIQRVDISPVGFGDPFLSIVHNFPPSIAHIPQIPYWLPTELSFFGRVKNLILYCICYAMYSYYLTLPYTELWKKSVPNSKFQNLDQLFHSTGLLLVPTDFALSRPRTLAPQMKIIGPILPEPPKPLPLRCEEVIKSGSFKDIIIVSFGTVISNFEESFVETLGSAFGRIPATVIWKHTGKMPSKVEKNVHIYPWFPQNDLLGHNATKVFITHGGLNSLYEASFHGIPVVVIPLFGDQFDNALAAVNAGIGEMINVKEMTAKILTKKIHQVLTNGRYSLSAKEIASKIVYPGRIMNTSTGEMHVQSLIRTPTEKAADWIEYGLYHNAGLHFRSEADSLSFIQVYMLDVILFLVCSVFVIFKLLDAFVRSLVKKCWSLMDKQKSKME